MSIFILSIFFPAVSAIITMTGESTAGEELFLTCSLSVVMLHNNSSIEWRKPDGETIRTGSGLIIGDAVTSGNTTNVTLHFSPLRTSHGGSYSCYASIVNTLSMQTETVELLQAVTVQSEYFLLHKC